MSLDLDAIEAHAGHLIGRVDVIVGELRVGQLPPGRSGELATEVGAAIDWLERTRDVLAVEMAGVGA